MQQQPYYSNPQQNSDQAPLVMNNQQPYQQQQQQPVYHYGAGGGGGDGYHHHQQQQPPPPQPGYYYQQQQAHPQQQPIYPVNDTTKPNNADDEAEEEENNRPYRWTLGAVFFLFVFSLLILAIIVMAIGHSAKCTSDAVRRGATWVFVISLAMFFLGIGVTWVMVKLPRRKRGSMTSFRRAGPFLFGVLIYTFVALALLIAAGGTLAEKCSPLHTPLMGVMVIGGISAVPAVYILLFHCLPHCLDNGCRC